ncbi:MAG: hypothetical protein A2Y82_01305 [Candidatus Buchananbacteria bacterium RBG_13_36_9]|uniref:Uncharacterized protein n=1 Tax=Candidatus Buchananbacteria bacterium RBG_13_36_9 TaxID=1797530 RepID=A0A1G1XNB2_9BACT|nr:MAG: hypothetical protein A2Y82_01305 [Candidatus Buchananbacteria bacterium RBG_13_36_9]
MDPENDPDLDDDIRPQDESDDFEVEEIDEETKDLMEAHDIDQDTAERAQELIDEGVDDEDIAVEIAEEGL